MVALLPISMSRSFGGRDGKARSSHAPKGGGDA
jgi:hypothetical protein